MSFWEGLALTIVEGLLGRLVKNPASVAKEVAVFQHIRDDTAELCLALNPSIAPPPGYKAA